MESIYKQAIGIDCSKNELEVCYGQLDKDLCVNLKATNGFSNDAKGHKQLFSWADKLGGQGKELLFVVEATGVYHQQLAYTLYEQGQSICVVLPSRASYFAKTLKVRTVTDRTACRALTTMGLEKNLDRWSPPHPLFAQLKQLTRERKRLKDQSTTLKNQRHAARTATGTLAGTLQRISARLQLCKDHVTQIEKEIKALINSDQHIKQQFEYVCSIDGVALITAATVVGEADGFTMVRNVRQLVSYAGYDVVQKQSGTSVRGAPRISKKGNSYIRRALYFPAITAVQHNQVMEGFHSRLHSRHKISMKAYTAVQRKLLVLIYTMWTKQEPYAEDYHQKKVEQSKSTAPHELA